MNCDRGKVIFLTCLILNESFKQPADITTDFLGKSQSFRKKSASIRRSKTVKSHQKERFCRINIEAELKSVAGTRFADNSYEGTFGDEGWGAGASAILLQTRGKDFRHEKTKKKRGTYRGGKIDSMTTRSIKYDSSSDEE